MKLIFLFFTLMNVAALSAQSKKESIELLTFKSDSLNLIINNERALNKKYFDDKSKELDSLKIIQSNYTTKLNSLKKDSTKMTIEIQSKSSKLSYKIIEFNKNREAIENIRAEIVKKNESLNQLIENEPKSKSEVLIINSQNQNSSVLTSNNRDKNCTIRTDRFNAILYPIEESDFSSLDEKFDENLTKVHIAELRFKDGSEVEWEGEHDGDAVYHNNVPFTGVAFTNNDFFSNGVWKKRGTHSEFHDGFHKGKHVEYYGDGKVKVIYYEGRKKSFDYKGNVISIGANGYLGGSKIDYFENGRIKEKFYFYKDLTPNSTITGSWPVEKYDVNGTLLSKVEYHCDKWPLEKYSEATSWRNGLEHKAISEWVEETEPYLHKYYLIQKERNVITDKKILYKYIKEDGQSVEIKDSIWTFNNQKTEYSFELSLEAIKKNERRDDIGEIKNGTYVLKNSTGIELVKGQYSNNKRQGPWKFLYEDGSIKCTANFENGFLSGPYKYYSSNGKIFFEGQYDASIMKEDFKYNQEYEGSIIEFPSDGRHGQFVTYIYNALNGPIKKIETYKNGALNGPYEIYQNGVLIEKGIKP